MKNYAIAEIYTKQNIIRDINMRICANEPCRFTDFLFLRHNDVIKILYWKYEFRLEIRVSNFVCVLNFNS